MAQDRRHFLRAVGVAGLAGAAAPAAAAPAPPKPAHDMAGIPASWHGKEQIAMLLYPGFTALDLVGPQYMLGSLMGATVHLVARTMAPVMSDTGLAIAQTTTLARAPKALDVLFVPCGGQGTLAAMRDLGLAMLARLHDDTYAKSVQLLAEYAPAPMFDTGTPERAGAELRQLIGGIFDGLRSQMRLAAHDALPAAADVSHRS